MNRFATFASAVCLLLSSGSAFAQDSYLEIKGALEWLPRLSMSNDDGNTEREVFLKTTDPGLHMTASYGWSLNDMVTLETDASFGQKVWNDIDWNGATAVAGVDDQDAQFASLMVNALVTPRLTDELVLGLGIGGGLVYENYQDDNDDFLDDGSMIVPGYQLKAKLVFEANATTNYMLEVGYLAGLNTDFSNVDGDNGLSTYSGSYSHTWTAFGVGYKF